MPYSEVPSENTDLLNAILNDETYYSEVSSRNAEILKSIANGTAYTAAPQSYIEELLLDLKEKIEDQPTVEALSVTENGTYSETGKAYSPVTVNVPGAPTLGTKTITANGTYNAVDDSLDGYSSVTVDIDGYTIVDDTTPASLKTLTTASYPMGACKVGIEAVQNLNGYSKPWAGGANINKFPNALSGTQTLNGITVVSDGKGKYTISGRAEADTEITFDLVDTVAPPTSVLNGGTGVLYLFNTFTVTASEAVIYMSNSTTNIVNYNLSTLNRVVDNYVTMTGKIITQVMFKVFSGAEVSGSISPMLVTNSSTTEPFSPYSNICPISGWDEVNLYKTNKNILPNKYYQVNSTTLALGTETADTFPVYLEANENYVLSFDTNKTAVVLSEKCEDETSATTHTYTNGMFNITSRNAGYYSFTLTNSSAITSSDFLNVMLEKGTTKTSYEAYNGQTYTETLATTNFGGYWDAVEGEVGTEKVMTEPNGTGTFENKMIVRKSNLTGINSYYFVSDSSTIDYMSTDVMCNMFEFGGRSSSPTSVGVNKWYYDTQRYIRVNLPLDSEIQTADQFNAWLAELYTNGTPLQFVETLATPTTTATTPRVINTNNGVTNVWADSGKIERAKYLTPLS